MKKIILSIAILIVGFSAVNAQATSRACKTVTRTLSAAAYTFLLIILLLNNNYY